MAEKLRSKAKVDHVDELACQSASEVQRMRSTERVTLRGKVCLRPGNSSEACKSRVQGLTADMSEGGCRVVFPSAVLVGDLYRMEFDLPGLELPLVFARCLRCRLIHETAFEAAFSFFNPVSLEREEAIEDSKPSQELDLL